MICDWEKCDDTRPHNWGDEGCEKPVYRCDICGEYFDETRTAKTGERAPYHEAEVCPGETCGSEDYTKMHVGFESGDEVVVLGGRCKKALWTKGVYDRNYEGSNRVTIGGYGEYFRIDSIFSQTKSGWLKLIERLKSQRATFDDAIGFADDEIKKLEEEEK